MAEILMDADGPMVDLVAQSVRDANDFLRQKKRIGYGEVKWTPEDVRSWDFRNDLFSAFDKELADHVAALWESPRWWRSLPPTAGSQRAVSLIQAGGHSVTVVTSPHERCVGWESARRDLLMEYFGIAPRDVHVVPRKDAQLGDILVDDKPSHVFEWERRHHERGGRGCLFSMPHNARVRLVRRVEWDSDGIAALIELANRIDKERL